MKILIDLPESEYRRIVESAEPRMFAGMLQDAVIKGFVVPDKIANKRFDGTKLCAHVCESTKEACRLMDYFIENGKLEIKAVDKARMEIHYLNGTTHVFMNEWKYSRWCIGRTYTLDDNGILELRRSGLKVNVEDK